MITANLANLELNEFTGKKQPTQHCRAAFPLVGAHGTQQSAAVYIEVEPNENLGGHTDSAEEVLLVLDGQVEVKVGEEKGKISKGEMAVVPEMVPHDLRNIGTETARILGFFGGANNIVATFDVPWQQADSNVVDTAKLVPLAATAKN